MASAERKLYEVDELLKKNGGPLPMSRAGLYLAINKGDIPSTRIGKRVFIPSWFVDKLLEPPTGA